MLAKRKHNGRFACVDETRNHIHLSDAPWPLALTFLERAGYTRAQSIAILVTRPQWDAAWRNANWSKRNVPN